MGRKKPTAKEMFEAAAEDFLKFERIPPAYRRHASPDLCAFLYIVERLKVVGDVVVSAEHDKIWLDGDPGKLTEADVLYLTRCGVMCEGDGLSMFV